MAKFVLRDAYVAIIDTTGGTVNLSDHCSSVEVTSEADDVDLTSFGPSAYREYGVGFKSATVTATFFSDFAASSVHQTLQPLYDAGGTFGVRVRPTSGSVSSTNPEAQMSARMFGYNGIAGGVGDAATFDSEFRNAGTAGLVWSTTAAP